MSTKTSRHGFWRLPLLSGGVMLLVAVATVTAPPALSKSVAANPKASAKSKAVTYKFGVPWEEEYGLSQGYSVNGTIYISGQFSHDMQGKFVGTGDFYAQMRQTLANIDRVLAGFGVTKSNIVEMNIYLTNPKEHYEPCVKMFKQYVGDTRPVGTLIGVTALAFPEQLIEIRVVAHTN